MASAYFCEFPDHLWFDVERDVWIEDLGNGLVRLGMTDPAQTRAGRVLHIRARAGKKLVAGKNIATIESGKWVGPFPAPMNGLVTKANAVVLADPNMINRDPYGEGWLVEVQAESEWRHDGIYRAKDAVEIYKKKLKAEGLTCMRCVPPEGEGNALP